MSTGTGWRAVVTPADHPVSDLDLDVIVGANGKSRSLPGAYVTAAKATFHSTKPQPLSISNSVFFNTNSNTYHTTLVYISKTSNHITLHTSGLDE